MSAMFIAITVVWLATTVLISLGIGQSTRAKKSAKQTERQR